MSRALEIATAKLEAARAVANAARVPDDDVLHTSEPVTTPGWYRVLTRSGRQAWAHCSLTSSLRSTRGPVTYDRDAEEALDAAAEEHYSAYAAQREDERLAKWGVS